VEQRHRARSERFLCVEGKSLHCFRRVDRNALNLDLPVLESSMILAAQVEHALHPVGSNHLEQFASTAGPNPQVDEACAARLGFGRFPDAVAAKTGQRLELWTRLSRRIGACEEEGIGIRWSRNLPGDRPDFEER
jgi:hypothetical protein